MSDFFIGGPVGKVSREDAGLGDLPGSKPAWITPGMVQRAREVVRTNGLSDQDLPEAVIRQMLEAAILGR